MCSWIISAPLLHCLHQISLCFISCPSQVLEAMLGPRSIAGNSLCFPASPFRGRLPGCFLLGVREAGADIVHFLKQKPPVLDRRPHPFSGAVALLMPSELFPWTCLVLSAGKSCQSLGRDLFNDPQRKDKAYCHLCLYSDKYPDSPGRLLQV